MSTRWIVVKVGDVQVAQAGTVLRTVGIGSCIALALHDPEAQVGGLAHALLPAPANGRPAEARTGRYVSTAMTALLSELDSAGADRSRLRAYIAGGASMFPALAPEDAETIGARNVAAAREALAGEGLEIHGEAVGGHRGRTVELRVREGELHVRSVQGPNAVI